MDFWALGMDGHSSLLLWLTIAGLTGETRGLFRRCLNCDPSANPTCPVCAADETCTLISPSCNACASTQCTKIGASSSSTANVSKTNQKSAAGPIAGGVIGGIAVIVLITCLVWRFCIKNRRDEWHRQYWQDPTANAEKDNEEVAAQRDARASTHTVGSIASTVLTRASNIIQIAYIPGVTNRSVESTPDLVPPVPPIPAASLSHSTATPSHAHQQDEHYFMPSGIRGSSYSDYTNDDRTSFARSSMAPSHLRSSVATYHGNVNPTPAKLAMRGKATPISLKSTTTGNNSPTDTPRTTTPPVPSLNLQRNDSSHSPIVARLGIPRAVTVTRSPSIKNTSKTVSPLSRSNPSPSSSEASGVPLTQPSRRPSTTDSIRHDGNSSTFDDASSSDEDSPADASLMGWDNEKQQAASRLGHTPFKSPSSAPDLRRNHTPSSSPDSRGYAASESRQKRHKRSGSLNQIIEEATRRASREPRHGGLGSIGSLAGWKREAAGPFSDAHAAS